MTSFPVRVRVDLDAVAANVAVLCGRAPEAELMAVVKAAGYGHGAVPVARAAVRGGAQWLGVAQLAEAMQVRSRVPDVPLLSWLFGADVDVSGAVAAEVDLAASSRGQLDQIVAGARRVGERARVHLKIDTGLGRNGATAAQWADLVRAGLAAQDAGGVELAGVWTHMAFADSPTHPSVKAQLAAFDEAVLQAEELGWSPQHRHAANSAATLTTPAAHYTLVRPGLAVYGLSPVPDQVSAAELGLRPAMRVEAQVALVKPVAAGQGVSYGLTYACDRDTQLALVPMGYGDGLPRHAGGRAPVRVAGQVVPVAGRMCMDQFVLDVGPESSVRPGDWVELFGAGDDGGPTAEDWAVASDTISYEIVTRMAPRLPRVYDSQVAGEGDE